MIINSLDADDHITSSWSVCAVSKCEWKQQHVEASFFQSATRHTWSSKSTSASNFPPSHCFLFLTPSASSSPSLFLFFCLFLRFVPFVSLSLLQNHGRLRYVYALFSKLFPCIHKKCYCFPTWIVTSIIVLLLYTCVSLCWEWFSSFFFSIVQFFSSLILLFFFFFLTDLAILFCWNERSKVVFKILQSPLCVAVVMRSSVQVSNFHGWLGVWDKLFFDQCLFPCQPNPRKL